MQTAMPAPGPLPFSPCCTGHHEATRVHMCGNLPVFSLTLTNSRLSTMPGPGAVHVEPRDEAHRGHLGPFGQEVLGSPVSRARSGRGVARTRVDVCPSLHWEQKGMARRGPSCAGQGLACYCGLCPEKASVRSTREGQAAAAPAARGSGERQAKVGPGGEPHSDEVAGS